MFIINDILHCIALLVYFLICFTFLEAVGNWVGSGITWEDERIRIKLLRYLEIAEEFIPPHFTPCTV